MRIEELVDFLSKNEYEKHFTVTLKNGLREHKRLFLHESKRPCIYDKGSKSYGSYLSEFDIASWDKIELKKEVNKELRYRNFFKHCVKYLEESGLWSDMLKDFKLILSNDELFHFILEKENEVSFSDFREKMREYGMSSGWIDSFSRSIQKGIKTINYLSFEKNYIISYFNEGEKSIIRWRKGYDCTLSKEKNMAWYSEEYVGCGNGHYYLALDAKHAIFCEDD